MEVTIRVRKTARSMMASTGFLSKTMDKDKENKPKANGYYSQNKR